MVPDAQSWVTAWPLWLRAVFEIAANFLMAIVLWTGSEGIRHLTQSICPDDLRGACQSNAVLESDKRHDRKWARDRFFAIRIESLLWLPVAAIVTRYISFVFNPPDFVLGRFAQYGVVCALLTLLFVAMYGFQLSIVKILHMRRFAQRVATDTERNLSDSLMNELRQFDRQAISLAIMSWLILGVVLAGWTMGTS